MRCRRLRRIYSKYIDGQLSERQSKLVEEHIRDCPDCAAEADYLERIRSLLRTTGETDVPDAYWDTYWDRLERKLPDEPAPVTLASRMLRAIVTSARQPAVLGRIAIYILLLGLVIYTTPDRSVKVTPAKPPMPVQAFAGIAEKETSKARLELPEAERSIEAAEEFNAAFAEPEDKTLGPSVEHATSKSELARRGEPPEIKAQLKEVKTFARPAPAKPENASGEALSAGLRERQDVVDSEDEYIAAEEYFKKGQYLQAIPAYQNFIKANLDDDRTLRAKYQLGEAYYQTGDYSLALSNFAAVAEASEDLGVKEAKALDVELSGYQGKEEDKSEVALKSGQARESDAEAARAKQVRASGSAATQRRIATYDTAEQNGVLPEKREQLISRAMFRQAESYEGLGKREEALAIYKKYVERYPQGKYLSQAKERIAQIER